MHPCTCTLIMHNATDQSHCEPYPLSRKMHLMDRFCDPVLNTTSMCSNSINNLGLHIILYFCWYNSLLPLYFRYTYCLLVSTALFAHYFWMSEAGCDKSSCDECVDSDYKFGLFGRRSCKWCPLNRQCYTDLSGRLLYYSHVFFILPSQFIAAASQENFRILKKQLFTDPSWVGNRNFWNSIRLCNAIESVMYLD